jgi:two-component system nitrogen regulation response regulator GlnG
MKPSLSGRTDAAKSPGRHWGHPLAREIDRLLAAGSTPVLDDLVRRFESIAIDRALAFTGGNRSHAARLLGMGRNTIARKIHELGMDNRQTTQSGDTL